MKIFISMPMNGIDKDTVLERMEIIKNELYIRYGYDIEFSDSFNTRKAPDNIREPRLWYLGHSLIMMADCDYICFSFDWQKAMGCQIEYETAIRYGLECIFIC